MREIRVEIDEELFKQLPDGGPYRGGKKWTQEEDEMLLRYWPIKNHEGMAKLFGVSKNTALKRYRQLTEEK